MSFEEFQNFIKLKLFQFVKCRLQKNRSFTILLAMGQLKVVNICMRPYYKLKIVYLFKNKWQLYFISIILVPNFKKHFWNLPYYVCKKHTSVFIFMLHPVYREFCIKLYFSILHEIYKIHTFFHIRYISNQIVKMKYL